MLDPNAPAPPGYRVEEDPMINKWAAPIRREADAVAASQADALRRGAKALGGEDKASLPQTPNAGGLSVMGLRMGGAPKKNLPE